MKNIKTALFHQWILHQSRSPVSAMWLATCGSFDDFGDQERIKSVFLTGHQSVPHLVMLQTILTMNMKIGFL
jgi:hypothetical protein